jgi:hypothetical protein
MAYEFQKLSEVEALAEVPEGANALIEVNGDIKRVPGSGLGGGAGKTLVIVDSNFTNGGVEERIAVPAVTYTANMTLDEAMEALHNCELTGGVLYAYVGIPVMATIYVIEDASVDAGMDCIVMYSDAGNLFWTADGISAEEPEQPK